MHGRDDVGGRRQSAQGRNRPPRDWFETFYSEVYDVLGREVTVISGFSAVLDRLDRADLPYVVCSNGRLRKMEIMLTRIGEWERLRGSLYSAQELGRPKPVPDVYLKAAADRGVAPADCVVVEDSMIGARAARASGMRCLGYARTSNASGQALLVEQTFDSMDRLPELLGV